MLRAAFLARQLVGDHKTKRVARSMHCTTRRMQVTTSHRLQLVRSFTGTSSPQNAFTVNGIEPNEENSIIREIVTVEDTGHRISVGLGSGVSGFTDEATSLSLSNFGRVAEKYVGDHQKHVSKRKLRDGTGVVTLKDGDVYEGDYKEGLMHGQGKLIYLGGGSFEGEFKKGKLWNGKGVSTRQSGAVYDGELREGKYHGQGKLSYLDGRTFEGDFQEGKLHGKGKRTYPDNRTQEGEFREGIFYSGFGIIRHKDGMEGKIDCVRSDGFFIGEIRGGKKWNGAFYTPGGTVMQRWVEGGIVSTAEDGAAVDLAGQPGAEADLWNIGAGQLDLVLQQIRKGIESTAVPLVTKAIPTSEGKKPATALTQNKNQSLLGNNEAHGKGQIKYPDGSVYEGEWLKTKKHGAGRLTSAAGEVFEGVFEKDVPMNGKGVLPLKDGGKYEGELLQPRRHGQGKLTYFDGRTLEGEFREGRVCNGSGVLILKDKIVFEGEFKDGKHHGQGKLTYPDGRTLEGEFREGKLWNGKGIITHKDKAVYGGEIKEGKMHGKGHIIYPDGRSFKGEFREGKVYRQSNGKLKNDKRSTDVGVLKISDVKEGKAEGQGTMTKPSGLVLRGQFREGGLYNGVGERKGANKWEKGKKVASAAPATPLSEKASLVPNVELSTVREVSCDEKCVVTKAAVVEESVIGAPANNVSSPLIQEAVQVSVDGAALAIPSTQFTAKNGAVFDGGLINANKKHGKGQIKYPDGSVYEGEWLKTKKRGAGRLTSAAGEVFEGVFEKDVPVSGKGVLPLKDGGKYEGELVQGKRHGLAKITNKKGVVDEVTYVYGKRMISSQPAEQPTVAPVAVAEKPSVYAGDLKEGQRHGQGKLTYPDGRYFEGEFKEGKLWKGKGVAIFGNGSVFVGEVKEGKVWSGKGVLTLKDGNVYEGELKEGKRHGQGKLSFIDGSIQEGIFVNNQFLSGFGSIRYKDGSTYEGLVQEGKRHDQGKMMAKDGAVWEGRWEADALLEGALTFANGEKLTGTFQAGKVWNAVLYSSGGGVKLRWIKGAAVDPKKRIQSVN